MGDLAHGRVLQTETACGRHAAEPFCTYAEDAQRRCKRPTCSWCSGTHAGLAHPAAAMADSPFRLPRTWWQAAQDAPRETIRLDLETAFYFTHLILVFKSPRPAAMVLERSQDFGETWKPYKYFAANCSAAFGLEDDVRQRGAICTSRYSSPFPCTGGEVGLLGLGRESPRPSPHSICALHSSAYASYFTVPASLVIALISQGELTRLVPRWCRWLRHRLAPHFAECVIPLFSKNSSPLTGRNPLPAQPQTRRVLPVPRESQRERRS